MQVSMFSGTEPLKITKKIRLIETFAGIGSQAKALKNIGADFEHYRICEFDKYAVNSYNAIHGTDFPVSDITKWHASDMGIEEKDKYEYIMTYSFPCQSLSVAGKGAGMAKGSGTRSGLLWEVERILEECDGNLPQVLLMENVDAILFEKNRKHFFQWCNKLEELGYKNYYEVLNAKHYGIPQNRNRCFMVSVLGDYYYEFPKPIKLELCVKDLLESEVAEKYYISAERVKELLNKEYDGKKGILPNSAKIMTTYPLSTREHRALGWTENVSALTARDCNDSKVVCQPCLTPDRLKKRENGRRFKENGDPMFTLTAQHIHGVIIGGMQKNQTIKKDGIAIRTNNEKGYDIAQDGDTINLEQPNSKTRRGRVGKQIAQTLNTSTQQAVVIKDEVNVVGNYMKSGYDASRIINPDGIAPAVKENHGTVTAVAVSKPELEKAGEQKIIPCEIRTDGIVTYKDKVMGCPRTVNQGGDKYIISYAADKETGKPMESYSYRIRKLTPRECFRLMGFKDIDFTKAKYKFDKESDSIWEIMGKDILESDKVKQIEEMGIKVSERTSNSQCYKQAGNSIVVDVLEAIFRNMNIKGVKRWQE